jgi:dipeptidyl aminopeptidase/acylaminoacyl peptidase
VKHRAVRWGTCILVVLGSGRAVGVARAAEPEPPSTVSSAAAAQLMVEVPRVTEVTLAPDGRTVVYAVDRPSVSDNQRVTELWLQPLGDGGKKDGAPVQLARQVSEQIPTRFDASWSPTGRAVLYFGVDPNASGSASSPAVLLRYDLGTRAVAAVPVRHDEEASRVVGPDQMPRLRVTTVPRDYRWSPTGRYLAFITPLARRKPLDLRRGSEVRLGTDYRGAERPPDGLFALDMETGVLKQISPDDVYLVGFDWAPDERALVVATRMDKLADPSDESDLAILDRATRTMKPLVTRPGVDGNPAWSPDGRWIAFRTHNGERLVEGGRLALVAPTTGQIRPLNLGEDMARPPTYQPMSWTPDSRGIYFSTSHKMTGELAHVSLEPTPRLTMVTSPEDVDYDRGFSFSADHRLVAFMRESLTRPAEVFIRPLPEGAPQALTQVAEGFPLGDKVRVDRVSWPSRDGKFTIHGMLVTPRAAWTADGQRTTVPLPTLSFLYGGPSMVQAGFDDDGFHGAMLPMAARGYAVLAPNTRGRGGYGDAFSRGIGDGKSYMHLPFEDMMTGLDQLVARGIADPARLGVYGHSYGASLTAYTITQTDRFRAAIVREAARLNLLSEVIAPPEPMILMRVQGRLGVTNPFDPAEQQRLFKESSVYHMSRVTTPTYLQFGASGNALHAGWPLFYGLQWSKVPVEFIVNDGGHGTWYPALIADELTRSGNWFDYWLRDIPLADPARSKAYDAWKTSRRVLATKSETKSQRQ